MHLFLNTQERDRLCLAASVCRHARMHTLPELDPSASQDIVHHSLHLHFQIGLTLPFVRRCISISISINIRVTDTRCSRRLESRMSVHAARQLGCHQRESRERCKSTDEGAGEGTGNGNKLLGAQKSGRWVGFAWFARVRWW